VLDELRVRDLGVIDDVTVTFGPGMTALTGETGAGKTLLVEALTLLLGGRADPGLVRAGAAEALVEARFVGAEVRGAADGRLPLDGPAGDEVLLARSVVAGGRSRAWVDGRMAPVHVLAEAAAARLELHGQHQHRTLVRGAAQRDALDRHGGVDRTRLTGATTRLRRLTTEREALGGSAQERAREADLLRYQIAEIEGAAVDGADEDARLEVEEDRLAAAAALREAASAALEVLAEAPSGSVLDRLAEVSGVLGGRPPLAPLDVRTRAAMADLSDLATELRTVVETWEDDPERLEAVRGRRQLLRELQRKYGDTLAEVEAFATRARSELMAVEGREARSAALDRELAEAVEEVEVAGAEVADSRRAAAPGLAAEIQATLRTLAMPSARFEVVVAGDGPADDVTFLLGANPGEPPAPLARVASGGELARTMLAVRLALTDTPGVLVFDEVDAGIGGAAATAVGAALAALARHSQVLVVTHLPQVAAQADHHLLVRKTEAGGRTRSEVSALDPEDRVVEVSRMLSGSPDSESAHAHARELLAGAATARGGTGSA
jgi:DNA repair protein RecN (Recombination protein N)